MLKFFILLFLCTTIFAVNEVKNVVGFGTPLQTQYAGLLKVDTVNDGDIFYWFFEQYPKQEQLEEEQIPLIIWLNGGPGCSSMTGLFQELGPYYIESINEEEPVVKENHWSWCRIGHCLFIDQPVGVGYGKVQDDGLSRTEKDVATNFHKALDKFYSLHPQYRKNEIYLTGESYAGKYIPHITDYLISKGVQVKGIAIGSGFIHPLVQRVVKSEQAYWGGVLNSRQRDYVRLLAQRCIRHIQSGNTHQSSSPCLDIDTFIRTAAGPNFNMYDYRRFEPTTDRPTMEGYLNRLGVQQAINIDGQREFISCNRTVRRAMAYDVLLSSRNVLYELYKKSLKILLFNGNFDVKDGIQGAEQYLRELNIDNFDNVTKNLWLVDGKVAGYELSVKNLQFVAVLGAGHFIPKDQPKHSFDMIGRFIYDYPFCKDEIAEYPYLRDNKTIQCNRIDEYLCNRFVQCENGKCISGTCICNEGYGGLDCSSKILPLNSSTKTGVLQQQEWIFYKQNVTNYKMINIMLRNTTIMNNTNIDYFIDTPYYNIQPSKLCMYIQKDRVPTTHDYHFISCETNKNLGIQVDPGQWYIGILNSNQHVVEYEFILKTNMEILSSAVFYASIVTMLLLFASTLLFAGFGGYFYYRLHHGRKVTDASYSLLNEGEMKDF